MDHLLDAYLAPTLVPTIMITHMLKLLKANDKQLLYYVVTCGTVLSTINCFLKFHTKRSIKSRSKLTLLTALLNTLNLILSILCFHLIRVNWTPNTYKFPFTIRDQKISSTPFRYHFLVDLIPSFIIFSQAIICSLLQHELLVKAKRKFTFGEATVLAQLVSTSYLTWALVTYSRLSGAGPFRVSLTSDIILNIGIIIFCTTLLPAYLFLKGRATLIRYALIVSCLAISYSRVQHLIVSTSNLDPLTWLIDYIFTTHQRISLFSVWLSTIAACAGFSISWTTMVGKTDSLVRKLFHVASCFVFITGYNQDLDFTRFAAGGFIVVVSMLEIVRAWQLPPMGNRLERICNALRGKWDNRYLTLSHIYLLMGMFLPLWLLPYNPDSRSKLALSCGLISVGVGDTAAAVIGTFYGRKKLKSGKTLEGLIGNILAMVMFKLLWVGFFDASSEFSFIFAAMVTSAVEALTNTCDNLILPLVMMLSVEVF